MNIPISDVTMSFIFNLICLILLFLVSILSTIERILYNVFCDIANLIQNKKIKKHYIIDYVKPIHIMIISPVITMIKQNGIGMIGVIESIFIGLIIALIISGFFARKIVQKRVSKELEFPYSKREAWSLFMTLFSSLLVYKWSAKIPKRNETEFYMMKSKKYTDEYLGIGLHTYTRNELREEFIKRGLCGKTGLTQEDLYNLTNDEIIELMLMKELY